MKKILILALLLRLTVAPFAYHGDTVDFLNWGKNLTKLGLDGFYLRDTPDAVAPNYPPGFYYLLLANQYLYEAVRKILWFINLNISIFPSNFYTWFESDYGRIFFNKLPSIFADLVIGIVIYKFILNLRDKKTAIFSSLIFLFTPPIWYISSIWGQTEALFALPLLLSFVYLYKDRPGKGLMFYILSLLIKPTGIIVLPIFLYWLYRLKKYKQAFFAFSFSAFLFVLMHIPFNPGTNLIWIINLYRHNIREVLGDITANAYNIWSFFFGFSPKPDSLRLNGIPAVYWGFLLYLLAVGAVIVKLKKKEIRNYFIAIALTAFSAFLFLTRIHERYFYLVVIFLVPLIGLDKKYKKIFFGLNLIFLLNLYHYWWIPGISLLIKILSLRAVEQLLVVFNFVYYYRLFRLLKMPPPPALRSLGRSILRCEIKK